MMVDPCLLPHNIRPFRSWWSEHVELRFIDDHYVAPSKVLPERDFIGAEEPSWGLLEPLLLQLRNGEVVRPDGTVVVPYRVEMISDDRLATHGALVFDDHGDLIIHVVDARLGANATETMLSHAKILMEGLGAEPKVLEEAAREVQSREDYMLVFHRGGRHPAEDGDFVAQLDPETLSKRGWGWFYKM